jgi:hypothetical protein
MHKALGLIPAPQENEIKQTTVAAVTTTPKIQIVVLQ